MLFVLSGTDMARRRRRVSSCSKWNKSRILSSLMLMNDWWTRIYHHRTVLFTYLIQFAGQAGILNLFTGLKFENKNNSSDNSMWVCDGLSENFQSLELDLAHEQHEFRASNFRNLQLLFLLTFAQVLHAFERTPMFSMIEAIVLFLAL